MILKTMRSLSMYHAGRHCILYLYLKMVIILHVDDVHYVCYHGYLTVVDGWTARKLNQTSAFGAWVIIHVDHIL